MDDTVGYLIVTIITIYFGQKVEDILQKGKREKLTALHRESYYKVLTEESLRMEKERKREESQLTESVDSLEKECEELEEQLEDSDWSDDNIEQKSQELHQLNDKVEEIEQINEDIRKLSDSDIDLDAINQLNDRIRQLELENDELKAQVKASNNILVGKKLTDLDPDLLDYIETHKEEVTLPFLEKAYETLLEVKASDPTKDFNQYIDDLKNCQSSYVAELAEIQVAKKQVEIKLQLERKRYEEEFARFNEIRVDNFLKLSGGKELLERLKEKNQVQKEIIDDLNAELAIKRRELTTWMQKFNEAEEQCNRYYGAWKDSMNKKAELEARESHSNRVFLNLSSASSIGDNGIPPPPPIEVPTIDEMLRNTMPGALDINSSIPPPPDLDKPFSM